MQANITLLNWKLEKYYDEKKIPVWVFDSNYELSYTNFTTSAILNLMESMRQMARNFTLAHSIEGFYLNLDNPYEMYFFLSNDVSRHQDNVIIIGPIMAIKPNEKIWKQLSFSGNLFAEQKRVISHALPVLSLEDFKYELANFFKNIIEEPAPEFLHKYDDEKKEEVAPIQEKHASKSEEIEIDDSIDEFFDVEELCRLESLYKFYIMNGSTYKLYALFQDEAALSILFPNKASLKDCGIRTIELLTIAKMASIESGNDRKKSHLRFHKYTEQLKTYKSYDKMLASIEKASIEFARNSHDINMYTRDEYSPMTNKCIKRIIEKLPEKVSLDDLAKELKISSKYLSALFNKETGSSITDFMQDIRVNEAKHLLTDTELSYSEISNLLNFSSQSYFNAIFKKKTGLTPKEYREQANQQNTTASQ